MTAWVNASVDKIELSMNKKELTQQITFPTIGEQNWLQDHWNEA